MSRGTTFTFYSDVNLSLRTNDNFYFADRSAQTTFFNSKIVTTVSGCSYQRSDRGALKVEKPYSLLYRCDYLSFINPDYENKRFYAYITGVKYIDDNTTMVEYVIDVVQTWLLDCSVRPCFVERNHANRDHFGDNMLPDSVECGDLIVDSVTNSIATNTLVIVLASFDVITWITSSFQTKSAPSVWVKDGIYDSLSQVAFYSEIQGTQAVSGSALGVFFEQVFLGSGGVTIDDIINIYLYPKIGVDLGTAYTVPGATQGTEFNEVYQVTNARHEQVDLPDIPTQLDGYTPKNKKTLTYPYCFIHVENNNGSAIDLKYERFRNGQGNVIEHPKAEVFGTTCGEAKIRLTPKQYMGALSTEFDFDYSIDSGSYPTISMVGDAYNIYLAQNKNKINNGYDSKARSFYQQGVSTLIGGGQTEQKAIEGYSKGGAGGAIAGATSGAIGSVVSAVFNAYDYIKSKEAEFADLQLAPSTATGISGIGLAYQHGKPDFTIVVKTLDYTHARMVDDFFTLFGYPVRRIEMPMLCARTKFTYIKTVGCILNGNVPEEAKGTLEALFDSGIRLWSSPGDIGNFNVINDPINS